jgi:hypothetical protein
MKNNETEMTTTATATLIVTDATNYKETLKEATLEKIEEWCVEGDFAIDDALEFIETYGESDFVTYYEDYIDQGERVDYEVVDAYIKENGVCCVDEVENAYLGTYSTPADFAEEYFTEMSGRDIPVDLVIDWEATWYQSLRYDYDFVEAGYRVGYVFSRNV